MDTTTPDEGAVTAQPATPAAVTAGYNADQVITTDDNGTPELVPATEAEAPASQASESAPDEAVSEEKETQAPEETPAADKTDEDIAAWSEKKGLKINPDNPNEVRLARMQLEAERKMHEANQTKTVVPPPELLPESEDPAFNSVIDRQNATELKLYVRDWFDANPEMKQYRAELTKIAAERPYLTDMEDVAAHLYRDPAFTSKLKNEGGREALTNLAQKQQQIPPSSGATNSGVYQATTITPQNVAQMVDSHDQAWFEKNQAAISAALEGKTLN